MDPLGDYLERGRRVRVRCGVFSGMEGEVTEVRRAERLVRIEVRLRGRPVPVELDYWQVEQV
jgi:transcription antitermination factor NusG